MRKILLIIKYDLYNGIIKNFWKIAMLGVIAFFSAFNFLQSAAENFNRGALKEYPSFLETLFYVLKGLEPLKPNWSDFQIPFVYSILFLGFAILTGDYITKDIDNFGQNIIAYSSSRRGWMLSKILWNLVSVIVFSLCILFGILIAYIIVAPQKTYWCVNESVLKKYFSIKLTETTMNRIIVAMIMIFLSLMVISLIQMTIAFISNASLGFSFVVANILLACSINVPYLIGNYTMLIRGYILGTNAITISALLIVWCINILFLILLSNRKNLLRSGKGSII